MKCLDLIRHSSSGGRLLPRQTGRPPWQTRPQLQPSPFQAACRPFRKEPTNGSVSSISVALKKKKFFFGAAYMFRNHMSGKKLLCHNHEVFMKGTHITAASSSQCVESSTRSKRCRWVPHTLCSDWQQPGQILKWISAALHKEYTVMSPLNDPNNVPYREIDSPSFALLYQHNISHEYSALKHH